MAGMKRVTPIIRSMYDGVSQKEHHEDAKRHVFVVKNYISSR